MAHDHLQKFKPLFERRPKQGPVVETPESIRDALRGLTTCLDRLAALLERRDLSVMPQMDGGGSPHDDWTPFDFSDA